MSAPLLIVGLGNPGPRYADTRHNLGHMVIDEIIGRQPGASIGAHRKTNSDIATFRIGERQVIAGYTRTMMNVSGPAVKALASFFKVAPSDIIVVHDELDLALGDIKVRPGGGDHGHNGLKSITAALGTKDYVRVSCGIGRPPGRMDPAAFVLGKFGAKEREELPIVAADAADAILARA